MVRPALKCNILQPVPLAFRKPPYGKEQMHYDPAVGLRMYGPYKAVDVKILSIRNLQFEYPPELFEALNTLIESILGEYLRKAGAKVKIDTAEYSNYGDLISDDRDKARKAVVDLCSIIDKDSVVLTYLPRYKLGEYNRRRIYAKIKALGLQNGFVSQLYSESILNAVRKLVKRGEDSELEGANAKLRNLSLNILAKAGGIPWALYNELEYDIIVGLSWSIRRSQSSVAKSYGVVHTFSRIGVWETFRALVCEFKDQDLKERIIVEAITEGLDHIAKVDLPRERPKYKRILILVTELLKEEHTRSLAEHVKNEYGYSIDIVMVSSYTPIRVYDPNVTTYLAPSGLYFLVSDDTAYVVTTGRRQDMRYFGIGVPKPIRIKLFYTSDLDDKVKALIRAVKASYALTAMNWRSFWGSLRVPTPIHYSRLVAQTFLLMDEKDIANAFSQHGKYLYRPQRFEDRPWFL